MCSGIVLSHPGDYCSVMCFFKKFKCAGLFKLCILRNKKFINPESIFVYQLELHT